MLSLTKLSTSLIHEYCRKLVLKLLNAFARVMLVLRNISIPLSIMPWDVISVGCLFSWLGDKSLCG